MHTTLSSSMSNDVSLMSGLKVDVNAVAIPLCHKCDSSGFTFRMFFHRFSFGSDSMEINPMASRPCVYLTLPLEYTTLVLRFYEGLAR